MWPEGWKQIEHTTRLQALHKATINSLQADTPKYMIAYVLACIEHAKHLGAPDDQMQYVEQELIYWVGRRMS